MVKTNILIFIYFWISWRIYLSYHGYI